MLYNSCALFLYRDMKETGQKGKVMNNMEMKSSNVSEVRIETKNLYWQCPNNTSKSGFLKNGFYFEKNCFLKG